jgi:uncharacterized protein YceK
MRKLIYYLAIGLFTVGCVSSIKTTTKKEAQLPDGAVRIANKELAYEIIILDIGFETYLNTIAWPANYYSQKYYEIKNNLYVTEWNIRVLEPFRYNPLIYENEIDYDFNIDYGLEVNYKLYYYFKFVEYQYKEKFPF